MNNNAIVNRGNGQTQLAVTAVVLVNLILLSQPLNSFIYKFLLHINATIMVIELFAYKRYPYTLHKLVNIFLLLFFVIANMVQYSTKNIVSSISIQLSDSDYELFQLIVFFILIIYNILYAKYFGDANENINPRTEYGRKIVSVSRLFIISFIGLVAVLVYFRNDPLSLVLRGVFGEESTEEQESPISGLLFSKILRALPFVCLLLCYINEESRKYSRYFLLMMLIALCPTSLARNAVAMYWLPIFIVWFKPINKPNIFMVVMLIGLFFIFPMLEVFRYWGNASGYSLDFLNSMHFDSSQELMIAIKLNFISWGYQLLGVLLFFVPRSLWLNKPVGSGSYMATKYDTNAFENISMPFFGEGYVNFGFMGILIFTVFLAWFCAKMDSGYWRSEGNKSDLYPYYLVMIGAMVFILRGDLLSSYSYTIATVADIYMVKKLTTKYV